MPVQLDVKRAAFFCVGHLVRRCQLVHRRVGGQTVCKKLLMAGHKLRVGNVEVVVRADAVILQRIQSAAKLPFDHNGMKPRRTQFAIEVGKLRRAHGLIQHLPDDLLLGHSEQRSVFSGGRRCAGSLKEDRQQLLLIGQRKNGRPVHLFGGERPAGNGSLGDMKELSLRGGQGHVRVPSPFSGFFDGVGDEQRGGTDERAQRVADHVVRLRKPQRAAVLGVLNSRAEDAADECREGDSAPTVPLSRQGIRERQPQREEEKHIHQHRAVEFWLLECGGEGGKRGEDELVITGRAGQDGGVEDDERSRAGERGVEKHSSPLSDPLAEHGPEKEQGQQQNAHRPWVHCVDLSKHRVLSLQAAHDAGQKALAPAFLRQFFFRRFAAGRYQIGKGRLTVALPKFIIAGGLLNGCKHRWVKGKRAFGCGLELQLILAAFQQAASLFTVNQNEGCALRIVGVRLNSLDAPIVRKRDVAATFDPFELAYKAGAAGVQSLDKTALIGAFGSGLGELSTVIKRGANMVRFPAICLVAEGERGQLAAILLLQLCFIFAPHQRRGDTVTGCVLRDQSLIVPTKVAFQRCDLARHSAEIDPATGGQRRLDLRIAVARNAALDILGAAKRRKLLHALSGSMYHMELSVKGRAEHKAASADDLRCQYGKDRAGRGSGQERSVLGVAG